jgi:hypothetical protein
MERNEVIELLKKHKFRNIKPLKHYKPESHLTCEKGGKKYVVNPFNPNVHPSGWTIYECAGFAHNNWFIHFTNYNDLITFLN